MLKACAGRPGRRAAAAVDIDREKANALGVSFADINAMLSTALGSTYVNDFANSGRQQRVIVQADAPRRMQPRTSAAQRAQQQRRHGAVSAFASSHWIRAGAAGALQRLPGHPPAGDAAPGRTGEAMAEMERLAQQLPPGFGSNGPGSRWKRKLPARRRRCCLPCRCWRCSCAGGAVRELVDPGGRAAGGAAGRAGRAAGRDLARLPNDVYFKVGLITIIGLSAKNAILIIEFAKDLQAQGKGLIEATLEAVHLRFRPIIMTSLAFILGVLPLVIATGAGSASQRAIGTGVMGGMITATVLAVFLVPVFFVVVRRIFKGSERQRKLAAHELNDKNHETYD
jgi:multidrug efflux pump